MIRADQYLEDKKGEINAALNKALHGKSNSIVAEAMHYSLAAGGKRLRPILTLATAETLGCCSRALLDIACAHEFIHTYSLIHDDLPAMDDSSLRRGQPTCHKVYGEAVAILAGDALLTHAFELVAHYGLETGCAKKALLITKTLARASGVEGMIGGQIIDLQGEISELAPEKIEQMALMKTGALLSSAVISGAIAADANKAQIKGLQGYASALGMAFQIVDDILDYESTTEELGKPTGADQVSLKSTFPALLGLKKAGEKAENLYKEAISSLEILDCSTDILEELAKRLVFRTR